MHFLCRSEWLLALLLSWVGCLVREQYPMWPWRHPGPRYGICSDHDARIAWSDGTLELCKALGIEHGTYVGTSIPYIWTIDLVATLGWLPLHEQTCAVISVKPLAGEEYTGDIDPLARGPEKLEVERMFAKQLSLAYFLADRSLFPGALLGQLEFYANAARPPKLDADAVALSQFLDRHGSALGQLPPLEWRDRLVCEQRVAQATAGDLVQHISWKQIVDVDLTRELSWEDTVRAGGHALIDALRNELMHRAT